ncbi:MAG: FliH/SctL family protein [Myxococcales bacterium]
MAANLSDPRRPRFLGSSAGERPAPQAATFPVLQRVPTPPEVAAAAEPKPTAPSPAPAPAAPTSGQASAASAPAPVPAPPAKAPEPPAARPPERPPRGGTLALGEAVQALRLVGARLAEQARADALEVAFQVARRILEAEISTSPQPLFSLVRAAVRRVGEARQVTLRVAPADAALIEAQPREELGLSLAQVKVVGDPSLARGECVLESDLGMVDGRMGARLDELRRSLTEALSEEAA